LHQTRTLSEAQTTTHLHQPLSEAFEPSQAIPYSLSYNLKKEMGLKYIGPFGKYYRGDIVVDHFENSEEDTQRHGSQTSVTGQARRIFVTSGS